MKSIAAALAAITLAVFSSSVAAQGIIPEVDQHKHTSFIRGENVQIDQSFSPFGNTLNVAKYGDDGSYVLSDLSGVMIWVTKEGLHRTIPGSELAVPVYVTNNELVVWNNKYADFDNYPARPDLDVQLIRADAAGVLTTVDLDLRGKELLETSRITTSTGSLVFATTERIDNNAGDEDVFNLHDDLLVRVYRVTYTGAVQRIGTLNGRIVADTIDFALTQNGPEVDVLAYGSDGSLLFEYLDYLTGNILTVWMNSTGVMKVLTLPDTVEKVVHLSDNRFVFQSSTDDNLRDWRRAVANDQVSEAANIAVTGTLLKFGDATTIEGNTLYFYTSDAMSLKVYKLVDDGADLKGDFPVGVGSPEVKTMNPMDGSAIISREDQNLIWIYNVDDSADSVPPAAVPGYLEVPNTLKASAMFVDNNECIVWANSDSPVLPDGTREDARIEHFVRNLASDDVIISQLPVEGTYAIEKAHVTPGYDYWIINTAEKMTVDTVLMRTHQLSLVGSLDTDNDGLLDTEEALLGTDPADPDSDGDGLTDGQEVNPYYVVDGAYSWGLARSDAQSRGGDLVTITDDNHAVLPSLKYMRVQAALGNLANRNWIGAYDSVVEGTFQWVSGEPFAFTNWAPGQPNNQNNSDGVELLSDFTWNDAQLDEQKGYILELPATDPNDDDTDGDGLKDGAEVLTYLTDPTDPDTDSDNYSDSVEVANGSDPLNASDPMFSDSDGDGLTDADEVFVHMTDPNEADSDGDGLTDGQEVNTYLTDPLNPDTDGDGVGDGLEVNTFGTDPTVDDFGGNPATPVNFKSSAVKGSYYGLVMEGDGSTVGYLQLKVTKKGSFSGRLRGYLGADSKFKGKMDGLGQYSGQQYNSHGLSSNADFQLEMAGSGLYRIGGALVTPSGHKQYFSLRRAIYSKGASTTLSGDYTMLVPSASTISEFIPAGDGVAYGETKKDGDVKFKGYSNAGNKFSYSGVIVEGDQFPFFVRPLDGNIDESMAGMLLFEDIAGESDINGMLRHARSTSPSGVYAAGYDEVLTAIGSRFVNAGFAEIPLDAYTATDNNAIASFTGGNFDGTSYIFTWEPEGDMKAPKLPTYKTSGEMNNKTGFFSGKYSSYDSESGFVKTNSKFRGVVIQKQNITSGQAINDDRTGRYSIVPNDTGDVAPSADITPRLKYVSSDVNSYTIQVVVEGPWQVVMPDDKDWINVDVTSGEGNREIVVTVEKNTTDEKRSANLKIAGLKHQLKQDPGDADVVGEPNTGVTISPTTYLVTDWLGGETYTINVVSTGEWSVSVPVGSSWIQALPTSGSGDGTVTVTVGTNPFFFTRTGTILIGDAIHRVSQWP